MNYNKNFIDHVAEAQLYRNHSEHIFKRGWWEIYFLSPGGDETKWKNVIKDKISPEKAYVLYDIVSLDEPFVASFGKVIFQE